jgi:hypothetical protein
MSGGVSILMPVFNERPTVKAAIADALSAELRGREAGKKHTAVDGLRVLRTLVRCRVT